MVTQFQKKDCTGLYKSVTNYLILYKQGKKAGKSPRSNPVLSPLRYRASYRILEPSSAEISAGQAWKGANEMPRLSMILLVLALALAVLGFGGFVVDAIAAIVKIAFVFFLIVFLASLVLGRRRAL